jgi:phage tail sheath gpL-like
MPVPTRLHSRRIIRGFGALGWGMLTLRRRGFVQGYDTFAQNFVVQRNLTDPDRVDIQFPADTVDPLEVIAIGVNFKA